MLTYKKLLEHELHRVQITCWVQQNTRTHTHTEQTNKTHMFLGVLITCTMLWVGICFFKANWTKNNGQGSIVYLVANILHLDSMSLILRIRKYGWDRLAGWVGWGRLENCVSFVLC